MEQQSTNVETAPQLTPQETKRQLAQAALELMQTQNVRDETLSPRDISQEAYAHLRSLERHGKKVGLQL